MSLGGDACTPGYYNNEGQGFADRTRFFAGHPQGAAAFFNHIDAWRNSGTFEGLAFG